MNHLHKMQNKTVDKAEWHDEFTLHIIFTDGSGIWIANGESQFYCRDVYGNVVYLEHEEIMGA